MSFAHISLGPITLHFYGFMYALAALTGYFLTKWIVKKKTVTKDITPGLHSSEYILDVVFWGMIGGVIGGRLFYILIYNIDNLSQILMVWKGGMSIHGGIIGGGLAVYLYARKKEKSFLETMDLFIPAIALGLAFGRLGNFVNGEIPGRETDLPWGIVYGGEYGDEPRHPWPLYAIFKDLILFGILLFFSLKAPFFKGGWGDFFSRFSAGFLSGLFLALLGIFRFVAEFWREPNYMVSFLSIGQLLSFGLFIVGIFLCFLTFRKKS